jgi:26S proteasome non-ATPase regulatory subunit 9
MGFTLPNPESPVEQARALMSKKDNIEAELDTHFSILKANNVTMQTPLVDPEGFPRADIDIYAVRGARVRIIELRNDLKSVMDAIAKALEGIFDPALAVPSAQGSSTGGTALKPFARVEAVAPGSPAAEAVRTAIYSFAFLIFIEASTRCLVTTERRPCREIWAIGRNLTQVELTTAFGRSGGRK